MKSKCYILLSVFGLLTCLSTAKAQCTTATYGQYPNFTFTNSVEDGTIETISEFCYAGEFSVIHVETGFVYECSSSIPSDYLTITSEATGTILNSGTGTVTFQATFSGSARLYTHVNSACAEEEVNRERRVGCSPASYCLNAGTYGQFPVDTYDVPDCDGTTDYEIASSCYAGEFSKVNVVGGNSYTFSSSVLTDYITISDAIGSFGIVSGTTPVTYHPTGNGIIRFYTHTNSLCGEEGVFRGRYVRCAVPQGCNVGVQWPQDTYVPGSCDGVTENVVNTDAYAGEYAIVTLANTKTYRFYSSVPGDYVTISNLNGTVVYAHGPSPLVYTPASGGDFRYYLHVNSQCETEEVNRIRYIVCSGNLGVDEAAAQQISIYPNPATTAVTISSYEPADLIEVLSVDGKLLQTIVPTGLSTTFSIEELQSGTYFVRMKTGSVSAVKELIKE